MMRSANVRTPITQTNEIQPAPSPGEVELVHGANLSDQTHQRQDRLDRRPRLSRVSVSPSPRSALASHAEPGRAIHPNPPHHGPKSSNPKEWWGNLGGVDKSMVGLGLFGTVSVIASFVLQVPEFNGSEGIVNADAKSVHIAATSAHILSVVFGYLGGLTLLPATIYGAYQAGISRHDKHASNASTSSENLELFEEAVLPRASHSSMGSYHTGRASFPSSDEEGAVGSDSQSLLDERA